MRSNLLFAHHQLYINEKLTGPLDKALCGSLVYSCGTNPSCWRARVWFRFPLKPRANGLNIVACTCCVRLHTLLHVVAENLKQVKLLNSQHFFWIRLHSSSNTVGAKHAISWLSNWKGAFHSTKVPVWNFEKSKRPMEGTFQLHSPDPSQCSFGYCCCKQDAKEWYWGQRFCQMETDVSVRPTDRPTEMNGPVKTDHLQRWFQIFRSNRTIFPEFWAEWKAPKVLWVVFFPRCTAGPNNVRSCCVRLQVA